MTQMVAENVAASFDLGRLPDDFYANPYPYYRALQLAEPIKRLSADSYLLTRFSDLTQVYKDHKSFSSDKKVEFKPKFGDTPLYEHHTTSLVFNDPPLHTRVRRLIAGALTPRAMAEMEPGIIRLVDGLLDQLAKKNDVDLIDDFAAAIPVDVIANLFGVPQEEREPLRGWSLSILAALEPVVDGKGLTEGNRAVENFLQYLDVLIARRRNKPGDPTQDVLTRLLQKDDQGEELTAAELLHNCIFLLNAGHETTTNLIGNGLVLLEKHPSQRSVLSKRPELARATVDEVLRYESPIQLNNRITVSHYQLGDVQMPAGTRITMAIGAANRDPLAFPEPDRFDIERAPNRHIAFGAGIHQCAGMNLARLEGITALARLTARFPDYQLIQPPKLAGRARFRGYSAVAARMRPSRSQ